MMRSGQGVDLDDFGKPLMESRRIEAHLKLLNWRTGVIMWFTIIATVLNVVVVSIASVPAYTVHSTIKSYSPMMDGPLSPPNISAAVSDSLAIVENGRIASERSVPLINNVYDVSEVVHRVVSGPSHDTLHDQEDSAPANTEAVGGDPSVMSVMKEKLASLDLVPVLNFLDFVREIDWKKAIATRFDRAMSNVEVMEGTIQALMKGLGSAGAQVAKNVILDNISPEQAAPGPNTDSEL